MVLEAPSELKNGHKNMQLNKEDAHPVDDISLRTSLLLINLRQRQVQVETTVTTSSVLGRTQDGDSAGHGYVDHAAALLHTDTPESLVHHQTCQYLTAASLHCPRSHNVVLGLSLAVDTLTHAPVLLRQHSRHAVLRAECLGVNILVVHEPLDINVNAAGLDDVGEDGVAVEDDL